MSDYDIMDVVREGLERIECLAGELAVVRRQLQAAEQRNATLAKEVRELRLVVTAPVSRGQEAPYQQYQPTPVERMA